MYYSQQRKSTGFGLIEVLITMFIVASGLLVLATFQGTVSSESKLNRIRSEAVNICENYISPFRKPLTIVEFDALSFNSTTADGQLDSYTVSAAFAPSGEGSNSRVLLTTTCTSETFPNDVEVVLSTILTTHSSVGSVLATEGENGNTGSLSPSLNANSSDDVAVRVTLADLVSLTPAGDSIDDYAAGDVVQVGSDDTAIYYVVDDGQNTASVSQLCSSISPTPTSLEDGTSLYARRGPGAPAFGANQSFEASLLDEYLSFEQIELYETVSVSAADTTTLLYCIPRVRYNGGVIIPIKGTVHSKVNTAKNNEDPVYLPLDIFTFDVSESGTFCSFDPAADATSSPYFCYVGGNCKYGPKGNQDTYATNYFECPYWDNTDDPDLIPNLNIDEGVGEGGWRGQVGLLNLASAEDGEGYNACFYEEFVDGYSPDNALAYRATSRNYFTSNIDPKNGLPNNEGLNKPFSCMDFVIIPKVTAGAGGKSWEKLASACKAIDIGDLLISSKQTERNLFDSDGNVSSSNEENDFDATIYNYCTASLLKYILTGTYSYTYDEPYTSLTLPYITASDGISTIICDLGENESGEPTYTCNTGGILNSGNITVSGRQGELVECTSTLAGDTQNIEGCELVFSGDNISGYSILSITGNLLGNESETLPSSLGGVVEQLYIEYNGTNFSSSYNCLFEAYNVATEMRPYVCRGYLPDSSSVDLVVDVNDQYTLIAEESAPANSETDADKYAGTVSSGDSVDFTIDGDTGVVLTDYTISGKIYVDADVTGVSLSEIAVNAGPFGECTKTGSSSPYDYSCTGNSETVESSITITNGGDLCSSSPPRKYYSVDTYIGTSDSDKATETIVFETPLTADISTGFDFSIVRTVSNCN